VAVVKARCSDPHNRGCVTFLNQWNTDGVCGPCQVEERRRHTALQPVEGERRDRKQVVRDYLTGRTSTASMIGAALTISYTDMCLLLRQLERDGTIVKVEKGGPGRAARYTAADDLPGAA
jgi:hypothetical protein